MRGWEYKKAKELVTFRTGKLDSNAAETEGKYPFFTCAQETFKINSYAFDTECVLLAGNNAAGIFPLKYYKGKFNAYQRTYIIEPKGLGLLNIRFLYESFKPFLKQFEQTSTGATTKFLTMGILNNLWLPLPPLPIQRKIAAVLSAYDDLIENNNRRIAILEKMAEELYREWFVRLRFPGHEKVKIVKGVPEGWEVKRIGELCNQLIDGDWIETKDQSGSDYRLLQVSNIGINKFIETGNYRYVSEDTFKRLNCTEVLQGDILVARMPDPTGRAWLVSKKPWKMITAVDVAILRNNTTKINSYYLIHYLNSKYQLELVNTNSSGTTRERITRKVLSNLFILNPPIELQNKFGNFVSPNYAKLNILNSSNEKLIISRDRLLSRLMSSKIDVENMDIQFPASMRCAEPVEAQEESVHA